MGKTSKIRRIQQVVIRWGFGGYNKEVLHREPDPPVVFGLDFPEFCTTLTEAIATLDGKEGSIEFVFRIPVGDPGNFARDELRARVHRMEEERLFADARVGIVMESKDGLFLFSLNFEPQSGEALTTTATHCFIRTLGQFVHPRNLKDLPIPQVSSKTFWRIGEEEVPFGVSVALDTYMGGAFKRIRRVFGNRGEIAAGELCRRLRIALLSNECSSLVFSETEGAEVLIGGSVLDWIRLSLLIDGYSRLSMILGSIGSLSEQAEKIAKIIKKYGLKACKITQGECLDFEGGNRALCLELEQEPFESFVEALRMEGIETNESNTAAS